MTVVARENGVELAITETGDPQIELARATLAFRWRRFPDGNRVLEQQWQVVYSDGSSDAPWKAVPEVSE